MISLLDVFEHVHLFAHIETNFVFDFKVGTDVYVLTFKLEAQPQSMIDTSRSTSNRETNSMSNRKKTEMIWESKKLHYAIIIR